MTRYPIDSKFRKMNWTQFMQHLTGPTGRLSPQQIDYLVFQRAYWDFEFFARYFFPHYCKAPFSMMHYDFCRAEEDPARRGRREVIAAPRANAKTSYKLHMKVIHAIVYGYEPYIMVLCHSAPDAIEKVFSILEELESNERLTRVYGALAPVRGKNPGLGRWGKKQFVSQNGVMVRAKSKGQDIRGGLRKANRPSLIILDDVESPSEVRSPEQRAKTRDWYYKDVSKCGQVDGSSNITVIGTCLHPESLLSELLASPAYHASRYQSVMSYANRQDLWKIWEELYTDLTNPNRHDAAHVYYLENEAAMLEGVQVLWPEGEPYEYLMRLRIGEGIASFQSEKQNDPYDPEQQLFDMKAAKRFRAHFEGGRFHSIHWTDGSGKIILRENLETVIAYYDPALGKKANQTSEPDFAAIVVVAKDEFGYLYCLDAYIQKHALSQQIENAFSLHRKWGLDTLYFEDNGFQQEIKHLFDKENNQLNTMALRVKGVTQTENKHQRISTLEPDITYHYLLFEENLNPRLIDQLTQFPTGYDDGPDALQGAVSKLKRRRDIVRTQPM